ncbi:integrase core domain-containing protein [Jiangella asiatica]|uniref:integrase core domain-containing protein n=1 Tax=Jiangella asiatica TaxID=2530372 RepID=UPI00193D7230
MTHHHGTKQTTKNWLRARTQQSQTISELQALLDQFRDTYNQDRPHGSLPHRATLATAYPHRPESHPVRRPIRRYPRPGPHQLIDGSGVITLRVNAACTTSASAELRSCCSSTTYTSASSTPPPANASANSPSTPRDHQPTHQARK